MRAVLIGGESLLIQCGEFLRTRHWGIQAVLSDAPAVQAWAKNAGLPVHPVSALDAVTQVEAFDWLLAVTHLAVIPTPILARAARGAVNFHDGPLPRYGGLQAPAWALYNGEPEHGITWHHMTAEVDGGPILVQKTFPIDDTDNALTLNAKCWAAALESFAPLVDALERGDTAGQPAIAPDAETFHGRDDRPEELGRLRPEAGLRAWQRAARAADTGVYANPFVSPWLWLGDRPVIVHEIAAAASTGTSPVGTIVHLADEALHVQVADGVAKLSGFRNVDGTPCDIVVACQAAALSMGSALPALPTNAGRSVELARSARFESHWVHAWAHAQPLALPSADDQVGQAGAAEMVAAAMPVPDDELLAALLLFFGQSAASGRTVGFTGAANAATDRVGATLLSYVVPLDVQVAPERSVDLAIGELRARLQRAAERTPFQRSIFTRYPGLSGKVPSLPIVVEQVAADAWETYPPAASSAADVWVQVPTDGRALRWQSPSGRYDGATLDRWHARFVAAVAQMRAAPEQPVEALVVLATDEAAALERWGTGPMQPAVAGTVYDAVREQAMRSPERVAIRFNDQALTYTELLARAEIVAHRLQAIGVAPDDRVAVMCDRSLDLVVALLGVLRAGAAYVPVDPRYPAERRKLMLADSGARILVTQRDQLLPDGLPALVRVDVDHLRAPERPEVQDRATGEHLAYVIYTSGSTGRPKGVMVEHRQVLNFFAGMDAALGRESGVWLAVTSVSFDISVLELFWTLSRGFTVVVAPDRPTSASVAAVAPTGFGFSLFYFSADEHEQANEKYRLMLEGARFADTHGFEAVWTPERHFHAFGGLYPNPAVTSAAIAAITTRVGIRAGSCVLPLHHPARVAEDWSVVDNLSGGRVAVSIAPGWQPNDFIFRPDAYADAKQGMFRDIETVQRLWRGESVTFPGPKGPVAVRTLPRPIQPTLPVWVTTAGNPETFEQAGRAGANLLTHLLGQSLDELKPKIAAYRAARHAAGHPGVGRVTLMLHTFIGGDDAEVRDTVREPMIEYLRTSVNLIKQYAGVFPTLRQRPGSDGSDVDFSTLTDAEMDALLEFSFERYYNTSALFGTVDSAMGMVHRVRECDVDEVACLVDFGLSADTVLVNLPHLATLREQAVELLAAPRSADVSAQAETDLATLLTRHAATHFQCTPSMARVLLASAAGREALGRLQVMCVGGEALPPTLAAELRGTGVRKLFNMYGPTETTVWSTVEPVAATGGPVPLGTPIVNTTLRVVDPESRQVVPPGSAGELWIGGLGVTRGYLDRPDLTAERFVSDRTGGRWYRTGDLVSWTPSGTLRFLGRLDHQVKVRGYRIELGEIEARIADDPAVHEVVVLTEEANEGDPRLVAYMTRRGFAAIDSAALRRRLLHVLPEFMVPTRYVVVGDMPRTPNQKIDRRALPATAPVSADAGVGTTTALPMPPRTVRAVPLSPGATSPSPSNAAVPAALVRQLEHTVAEVWQAVLRLPSVRTDDNFFDLGGHSLLIVQVHQRLISALGVSFPVTDLFRFATVHAIARHLAPMVAAAQPRGTVAHAPDGDSPTSSSNGPAASGAVGGADHRAAQRLAAAQRRIVRRST